MIRDVCIAAVMSTSPLGDLSANLSGVRHWVQKAVQSGAEIICFPELNLTGYSSKPELLSPWVQPIPGPLTHELEDLAGDFKVTILAGLAEADEKGRIYASHVVARPKGTLQVYRKIHLALPEQGLFTPGNSMPVFDLDGVRIGIQLCYDAHFPQMSTAMALEGVDIIFMPHASPRGEPDEKRISWMRHLPARAFDNGIFVVACNQVGGNGCGLVFPGVVLVFGPDGKILAQATGRREEMVVADLARAHLKTLRDHPLAYFLPHRREDIYPQR
jgi:N-carbamoylputrescine amidase